MNAIKRLIEGNYILDAHKTSFLLTLDKSSDLIYNDGTLAIRLTKPQGATK